MLGVILFQRQAVLGPHMGGEGVAAVLHPLLTQGAGVLAAGHRRLPLQELLEVGGSHLVADGQVGGQRGHRAGAQLQAAQLAGAGRTTGPALCQLDKL